MGDEFPIQWCCGSARGNRLRLFLGLGTKLGLQNSRVCSKLLVAVSWLKPQTLVPLGPAQKLILSWFFFHHSYITLFWNCFGWTLWNKPFAKSVSNFFSYSVDSSNRLVSEFAAGRYHTGYGVELIQDIVCATSMRWLYKCQLLTHLFWDVWLPVALGGACKALLCVCVFQLSLFSVKLVSVPLALFFFGALMLVLQETWKILIFSDKEQWESDLQLPWMSSADVLFQICKVCCGEHF